MFSIPGCIWAMSLETDSIFFSWLLTFHHDGTLNYLVFITLVLFTSFAVKSPIFTCAKLAWDHFFTTIKDS
jgi:hypothetical protein